MVTIRTKHAPSTITNSGKKSYQAKAPSTGTPQPSIKMVPSGLGAQIKTDSSASVLLLMPTNRFRNKSALIIPGDKSQQDSILLLE